MSAEFLVKPASCQAYKALGRNCSEIVKKIRLRGTRYILVINLIIIITVVLISQFDLDPHKGFVTWCMICSDLYLSYRDLLDDFWLGDFWLGDFWLLGLCFTLSCGLSWGWVAPVVYLYTGC